MIVFVNGRDAFYYENHVSSSMVVINLSNSRSSYVELAVLCVTLLSFICLSESGTQQVENAIFHPTISPESLFGRGILDGLVDRGGSAPAISNRSEAKDAKPNAG